MACPVCRSEARLEINGALESGELSQNEIARRFSLSRISVQRHARSCLKLEYSQSAEEQKLRDIALQKHEGRLTDALESARAWEKRSAEKGDQVSEWRAKKEVSKILVLMDRAVKKQTPRVTATSKTGYRGPVRILPPEKADFESVGLGELWDNFFSPAAMKGRGDRQRDIPQDAPTVRFSIEWRRGEIENADAEPEKTAEEAEAALKVASEVEGAKDLN